MFEERRLEKTGIPQKGRISPIFLRQVTSHPRNSMKSEIDSPSLRFLNYEFANKDYTASKSMTGGGKETTDVVEKSRNEESGMFHPGTIKQCLSGNNPNANIPGRYKIG